MKREELEHIIRAAAAITNQYEFMVIGSQSVLGAFPCPPDLLCESMEADIYPLLAPDLSDLIDGSIGESSVFHQTFGYYAQGVGPETALLPPGWKDRRVKIQGQNTDLKIAYCLEPHDLAASKLVAGREKDLRFVAVMLKAGLVEEEILNQRIEDLPCDEAQKYRMKAWVSRQERFEQDHPTQ